jgi:hypothetical protein
MYVEFHMPTFGETFRTQKAERVSPTINFNYFQAQQLKIGVELRDLVKFAGVRFTVWEVKRSAPPQPNLEDSSDEAVGTDAEHDNVVAQINAPAPIPEQVGTFVLDISQMLDPKYSRDAAGRPSISGELPFTIQSSSSKVQPPVDDVRAEDGGEPMQAAETKAIMKVSIGLNEEVDDSNIKVVDERQHLGGAETV